MYYGIKDIALRIPLDQIKFAAAFFNGNKAPVIGHIGQQPGHDRGFAGAGGAGNADGHPISDTGSQKVKHFSSGTAGVQQFFFTDGLLVDNTDGGIDAYITNLRFLENFVPLPISENEAYTIATTLKTIQKKIDIEKRLLQAYMIEKEYLLRQMFIYLKSATKLFSVLLASKRPLITELADKLRLKYPLCPQYPLAPLCDLRQYAVSYP